MMLKFVVPLFVLVLTANAAEPQCTTNPDDPMSCTDNVAMLQGSVNVGSLLHDEDEETMQDEDEDDETSHAEDEQTDQTSEEAPGDTDSACTSFEDKGGCKKNGCSWNEGSCEDDDNVEGHAPVQETGQDHGRDTDQDCTAFKTQTHCKKSGCSWDGSCQDDGSATSAIQVQESQTANANEGSTEKLATTWCRRRRGTRRRRWSCRRRRAPRATVKKAPKDGHHQECWTAGGCKDNGKNFCPWCGQHNGALMYCCGKGTTYSKTHACSGATFNQKLATHHCVAPGKTSTASTKAYKWLDLSKAKATASTSAHGGAPSRAIDGSSSSAWAFGSCTHTATQTNPWLQVDLGSTQTIKAITLTNRGDCCNGRLNGASVYVGDKKCATIASVGKGATKLVNCDGVGNTVKVKLEGSRKILTICELRVAIDATPATAAPTPAPTLAPTPAPTAAPTPAPTEAPAGPAPAPTPAPTNKKEPELETRKKNQLATNTATDLFNRIDVDNNNKISRDEFSKAKNSGKFIVNKPTTPTTAPTAPTIAPPSCPEDENTLNPGKQCYQDIWEKAGCNTNSPAYGNWQKTQTVAKLKADSGIWSAKAKQGVPKYRKACWKNGVTPPPRPPGPPPASTTVPTQAQKDAIVHKHNVLRAGMGASDMTKMVWDDTLANAAQQYVSGCPKGHSQNRNGAGENIAWKWSTGMKLTASTDVTPSVQSWYDEYKDAGAYKNGGTFAGFSPCTGVCGHYTQVVWAAANKIGCGVAFCPHSTGMAGYELVCQYGSSVNGAHGGNMGGSTLFSKGTACSKCPSGFGTCSGKLCST